MAQTGYTPILIYASGTTGNTPSASNLTSSASGAELALNYFDGRLFYKDASGVVQVLAGKGGSGVVAGSNTQVQYNNNGVFGASANMVFNGTRLTVADFADSSLTSGRVTYVTTGGNLTDSANLTYNGTTLALSGGPISNSNGGLENYILSNGTNSSSLQQNGTSLFFNANNNTASGGQFIWRINSAEAEQMRLTSTGLGIGTASPFNKLHVSVSGAGTAQDGMIVGNGTAFGIFHVTGASYSYRGVGANTLWIGGDGTPMYVGTTTAQPMLFGTNAFEYMRLDTAGNLGIGTSSPAARLHVVGGTAASLTAPAIFVQNNRFLTFQNAAGNSWAAGMYADSSDNFAMASLGYTAFFTGPGPAERMRITSAGDVGIGTSSPATRLEVVGNNSDSIGARITNASQTSQFLSLSMAGATGHGIAGWDNSGIIEAVADAVGSGTRALYLSAYNGPMLFATNGRVERARIDSSGNLLVGTTNNAFSSRLCVQGTAGIGTPDVTVGIPVNSSSNTCFTIARSAATGGYIQLESFRAGVGGTDLVINATNGGTVLVGGTTQIAGARFNVRGTNSYIGVGGTVEMLFGDANGSEGLIGSFTNHPITFRTNNTERARIDTNGNLLVGTTSNFSLARLRVEGDINTNWNGTIALRYNLAGLTDSYYKGMTGNSLDGGGARGLHIFNFDADANLGINFYPNSRPGITTSPSMTLDASGNLGLGTTSITQRLEVNGNIRVSSGSTFFSQGDLFIRAGSGGSLRLGANNANDFAILNTAGNLGLGVTPSAWDNRRALQVGAAALAASDANRTVMELSANSYLSASGIFRYLYSTDASLYQQASGQHRWLTAPSGTAGNAISFTQAMTLDASGNLGVGTTSLPSGSRIAISGGALNFTETSARDILWGTSSYVYITGNQGTGVLAFGTGSTERARIDSSGNLLVGTTSTVASGRLVSTFNSTNNTAFVGFNTSSANNGDFAKFVNYLGNTAGSISHTGITTVAYNTSSDYRLKEDIAPMTGALAKVAALKPCTYKWKADGSAGEGFIAHELAEVVPQAVTGEKDAVNEDGSIKPQGIDTSFLVATLAAAIQELKAEFDAYKATHP